MRRETLLQAGRTIQTATCFLAFLTAPLSAQPAGDGNIVKVGSYFTQTYSGDIAGRARLRVNAVGDITILGADSPTVSYRIVLRVKAGSEQEARQYFQQARAGAASSTDTTTLVVGEIDCGRCGLDAEIQMTVPQATADAVIVSRGGKLDVRGIRGRVNADSAGGTIIFDQIGGDVLVTTGGGNIELGAIGQDVRCETAGGSITLASSGGDAVLNSAGGGITVGRVRGRLQAETVGGSIEAEFVGGKVAAATTGGSISIGEAGGEVTVDTAGGTIRVSSAPGGIHAETASGDIRLNDVAGRVYALSAAGNVQAYFVSNRQMMDSLIETNAGSIVLFLPADMRVTIEAMVDYARNVQRIESEFPDIQITRGDSFSGVQAVGRLNGGGPVLRVRNTSGRIIIRRRE